MNEKINTISEEQVLHNELSFEINQELIHLMKRIVEIQRVNQQLKDKLEFYSGLELDKTIDKTRLEYNKLQQENKQLKNDNAVMKTGLIQASNKQLDLYKEVVEEVREYIEDWLFDAGGNGASMSYEDINELLQILDKVKEN